MRLTSYPSKPKYELVRLLACGFLLMPAMHVHAHTPAALETSKETTTETTRETKVQQHVAYTGYTGLINTPSAHVLAPGMVDFGYNTMLDDDGQSTTDGHNFVFSAGLFEGFEINGFIASTTMHDNTYTTGFVDVNGRYQNQMRDLSVNAKYQLPITVFDKVRFAVGGKDIAGAAVQYATYYGVASADFEDIRLSAGMAKSDRLSGQMDGFFAGLEWQVTPWLGVQLEHDGRAQNAALRANIPSSWVDHQADISVTHRIYSDNELDEGDNYWGMNIRIPLSSISRAKRPASPHKEEGTTRVILPDEATQADIRKQAIALRRALRRDGFANLMVGFTHDAVVISAENTRFNHNDIDALGLILGRVTEYVHDSVNDKPTRYFAMLSKQHIPVTALTGTVAQHRAFLMQDIHHDVYQYHLQVSTTPITDIPAGVTWIGLSPSHSTSYVPVVTLSPALSNVYASELGVYDYSLALRADAVVPLWQGAGLSFGGQVNIENSDDFATDGPFKRHRQTSQFDRALVYQTLRLPFGVLTQTQLGWIKEKQHSYAALLNETTWYTPSGRHLFSAQFGYFDYRDVHEANALKNVSDRDYQVLNYQYSWYEKDITLHASAGKFWAGDTSARVESRFWFGDSYLGLYAQYGDEQLAGLTWSITLSPRRDMALSRYGQVKATSAWQHSVNTRVNQRSNNLQFGLHRIPRQAMSLTQDMLNRGRVGAGYYNNQLPRLRDAYFNYQ